MQSSLPPHITTRLSSGTYIARCGTLKVSSTSSHETAALNLLNKYYGAGFVPVRSKRLEKLLRRTGVQDWEFQVWTVESARP